MRIWYMPYRHGIADCALEASKVETTPVEAVGPPDDAATQVDAAEAPVEDALEVEVVQKPEPVELVQLVELEQELELLIGPQAREQVAVEEVADAELVHQQADGVDDVVAVVEVDIANVVEPAAQVVEEVLEVRCRGAAGRTACRAARRGSRLRCCNFGAGSCGRSRSSGLCGVVLGLDRGQAGEKKNNGAEELHVERVSKNRESTAVVKDNVSSWLPCSVLAHTSMQDLTSIKKRNERMKKKVRREGASLAQTTIASCVARETKHVEIEPADQSNDILEIYVAAQVQSKGGYLDQAGAQHTD